MQLPNPTTVTLSPAIVTATNNVTINFMNDDLSQVTAQVQYDDGTIQNIVLWNSLSNPTYTQIGNWTQQEANDRIVYLLTGGNF